MELYTVEHHWQNRESAESVVLGVYTTRDAAWQAMRNTAVNRGKTDVPSTPQPWLYVRDGLLEIVRVDLNGDDDDDTTIPRNVFFLQKSNSGFGHSWRTVYRNRRTAEMICEVLAYGAHDMDADARLVRHGSGFYSLVRQPGDREVWKCRVIGEPVRETAPGVRETTA